MIACNLCGKHNATIYFKGIVNDQAIKLHLCAACAKKNGMVFPFGEAILSLGDIVASFAAGHKASAPLVCRKCGLTSAEFKQSSQLGCAECYSTFATFLGPLLKKIHGSSQHVGKTARRTVRVASPMEELTRLKLELRQALQAEGYERAASLRDQIQTLERQMTSGKQKA